MYANNACQILITGLFEFCKHGNLPKVLQFVMKRTENIVEKGETNGKKHFFILLHFLVFKTILSLSQLG